jgi:DNA repair protein RecO (recombination protein O)
MPLIETESLVLKTYNLAEADRIVVFLTRDHGVVRGVARGAKRLKSRFGSTMELFSVIDLSYFQKEERELVSIQNAELVSSAFGRATSPDYLDTFSYVADLILQFALPHDPNETLYRMFKASLDADAVTPPELAAVKLYCELWVLRLAGYLPDWSRCEDCGRAFGIEENATLRGGFHLHCQRCRKGGGIMDVHPIHREIFTNVQRLKPSDFVGYATGREEAVRGLSLVMKRLIANIVGDPRRQQVQTENSIQAKDAA